MGQMINGEWVADALVTADSKGRFVRKPSVFRCGGVSSALGEIDSAGPGRYHLYVSYACPWACRVLAVRALKGLEDALSVSMVDPLMGDQGWAFSAAHPDHLGGRTLLQQVYRDARPDYTGRVTVPILWDRQRHTIVCNESSEIMRILNRDFAPWATRSVELFPEPHRQAITEMNDAIYETVNNGVYRCGFAQSQAAYEEAVGPLFDTLDWLEAHLTDRRWLVGSSITEADIRLFVTLIRFDPVYVAHFRCSRRRVVDYPNLWRHTRDVYQQHGIASTVNLSHIKRHYFGSHRQLNPSGIVPEGPMLDYRLDPAAIPAH